MNIVLENGGMPEWKIVKNMTMFANEVMPRIREKGSAAARRRAASSRRG